MRTLRAVDLFCGAGGLTRGLLDEGVHVLRGYDLDPACRFPYEHNNGIPFIRQDVNELEPAKVACLFPKGAIRVVVGCAPCQPYSNYSRNRKSGYEDRWHLLGAFGRIVAHVRPELATIENVIHLRKHPSYAQLVRQMKRVGYHWTEYEVKCEDYGVPQTRTRLVAFASVFGAVEMTPPTHFDERKVSVRDAIRRMPALMAGESDPNDRLHVASGLSNINLQRIRASKPGGTWREWDDVLIAACHKAKTGKTYPSVYGRMEWDKPGPTITTQFYGFGSGRFGHPEQDRALSLREGALLQTFAPGYEFVASGDLIYFKRVGRLIGNAVPVLLARAVARSLKQHLEQHDA